MRILILLSILLLPVGLLAQPKRGAASPASREMLFDADWLFAKGSFPEAEKPDFADGTWRKLDLPHDWSIEDLPNQQPDNIIGPFSKASIGSTFTGFTVGGTGWYRKKFLLPKATSYKAVTVCFDGVYMNSDVWLNGHHLGAHPYGYSPFYYDLTPYLKPAGQENLLAVRVRNEGKNSRWYSGSGIYRHVWLTVAAPLHVSPWGVFVTTPEVAGSQATVAVATTLVNQQSAGSTVSLVTTILSPTGTVVGTAQQTVATAVGASATATQRLPVASPALWSPETPTLYTAVTEVKVDGTVIDRVETRFGIRSIRMDAANGLLVNGKKVLLKGGCLHHDNGPLGAAALDRAEERKVEILKQNGFNAIRLSHNPPSRQLLDACDRLGMLVIDEAFDMWVKKKNDDDYHLYFKDWWNRDLTAMLLRDRNHPAIFLWSIGNEIPDRADSVGLATRRLLKQRVRELDPTRLVTEAINRTPSWETRTPPIFQDLDVGGYNYVHQKYAADHASFPQRIMIGTESYPKEALENWTLAEQHPYVLGDFVWTAFDYLGEASVGNVSLASKQAFTPNLGWPWFNAYSGDFDLIGTKKAPSYYRDVVWRTRPIALAVHAPIPVGMVENVSQWGWPDERQSWTWPGAEGKPLQVRVFSRSPLVRLLLNGKVVGEQKLAEGSITAIFEVPYQPGTLKAVNVENGKETDSVALQTTGAPSRIRLSADRMTIRADRIDLSYVLVDVVDDQGRVVPNAVLPVDFAISGAGEIAAVGNGSPTEMASYQHPQRNTWRGQCLVIVRSTTKGSGKITLRATAKGMASGQVALRSTTP